MTGITDKRMERINLVNDTMNELPAIRVLIVAKAEQLVRTVEHNHSETVTLLREIAELNRRLTKLDKIAMRGI